MYYGFGPTRRLSREDRRRLQTDLADERAAARRYALHASQTRDPGLRSLWQRIRRDELRHAEALEAALRGQRYMPPGGRPREQLEADLPLTQDVDLRLAGSLPPGYAGSLPGSMPMAPGYGGSLPSSLPLQPGYAGSLSASLSGSLSGLQRPQEGHDLRGLLPNTDSISS